MREEAIKTFPKSTFEGYLKHISLEKMDNTQRALFELLFPLFLPRPTGTVTADNRQKDTGGIEAVNRGLVVIEHGPTHRPRRFAGYSFPGKRYYSLSKEQLGRVDQTLAHELRAYRNPRDVGFIDVLDLGASRVVLGFNTPDGICNEPIEADQAIAVLVHDFENLRPEFRKKSIRTFRYGDREPLIGMFKFPYESVWTRIEDVIDLRLPHVRDWFFVFFSTIAAEHRRFLTSLSELPAQATIAYSRFHLEHGVPDPVNSFRGMLPTLLNPDLGGGNPASTGSTLTLIAQRLRQASVAAFIYPSARSDVTVTIVNDEIVDFEGWNLVDFREADVPASKKEILDCSPWCWQRLPSGVTIAVGEKGDKLEGSLSIEGLVNYSAMHYKQQNEAVKHIKKDNPGLFDRGVIRESAKPYFSWRLGGYVSKWIRSILFDGDLRHDLMGAFGCATLLDVYDIVGRIDDLANIETDNEWLNNALIVNTRMGAAIIAAFDRRYSGRLLSAPFLLGQSMEQCIFYLLCMESWGHDAIEWGHSNLNGISARMTKEIEQFAAVDVESKSKMEDFFVACEKRMAVYGGGPSLSAEAQRVNDSVTDDLLKAAMES